MWDRIDWLIRFAAVWFVFRTIVYAAEQLYGSGFGPVAETVIDWMDALVIGSISVRMALRVWQE